MFICKTDLLDFMKLYFLPLFLLLILLVTSCDKDVLEMPAHEPRLVVSGYIFPDSCYVLVSATEINTPDTTFDPIVMFKGNQATAVLYEDGVFFDSLQSESVNRQCEWPFDTVMYFYVSLKKTNLGSNYRLEVSCPGYPSVSAETILPPIVQIIRADTSSIHFTGLELDQTPMDYTSYSLGYYFNDPADKTNYYMVAENYSLPIDSLYRFYHLKYSSLFDNNDFDVNSEDSNLGYRFFSDRFIDGTENGFEYFYGSSDPSGWDSRLLEPIGVRLYSLSVDYYGYLKSKLAYIEAEHDPNSEPVIMYSNVQGGYGIFAGISYSEYTYRFAKE